VYFEGPNCTGASYFYSDPTYTTDRSLVQHGFRLTTATALVRDMTAPLSDPGHQSYAYYDGTGGTICFDFGTTYYWHGDLARAAKAVDVGGFAAPFTIR